MTWSRLIRFIDDAGRETFGEPCIDGDQEFETLLNSNALWAIEMTGQTAVSQMSQGKKVHVKELRPLLQPSDVPIIRCIGLNYIKHSKVLVEIYWD